MTTPRTYRLPEETLRQLAALRRSYDIEVTETAVIREAVKRLADERLQQQQTPDTVI